MAEVEETQVNKSEVAKKKSWFARHKVLTVVLAIVILAFISSLAGGGSKTNDSLSNSDAKTTVPQANASTSDTSKTIKIGEAARDGKFEFVVKSFSCGETTVGSNQYLTKNAQGQYCLLTVNIKNIGTEKQSLFSANQKLLKGKIEYSADDVATMYAAPSGNTWYSDINPGNSVEGTIVFDVPKDVSPDVAELHDSAFSNGVKVSLQ